MMQAKGEIMRVLKSLEEISDGKLYDIEDRAKAGTSNCERCSVCCHDIGDLVELSPYDAYEMVSHLGKSFDELLGKKIALQDCQKIQLPYLKMMGEDLQCSFLNGEGRCSIHGFRPNICRLFPLGRVYQKDDFKYFLQVESCVKPLLHEVSIKEWLGIANYEENKTFILAWYQLLKALHFRLKFVRDENEVEQIKAYVLDTFYRIQLQEGEDFYAAFWRVLPGAKQVLGII